MAAPTGADAIGQMKAKTNGSGGNGQRVNLVELSVVLVATSNNPSIINRDFLIHNEIVGKDCPLREDSLATPVFSQVAFEGGVTVRADPDRVMFIQSTSEVRLTNIICADMAERYVRTVPHVPYRAVGINPKFHLGMDEATSGSVANALKDRGSWLSYKDSEPEIQLKAIYPFSSRKIIMDVLGATRRLRNGQGVPGLLFTGNIHRDLGQTTQQGRIEALVSIIRSWENDVLDFGTLVHKFELHAVQDLT